MKTIFAYGFLIFAALVAIGHFALALTPGQSVAFGCGVMGFVLIGSCAFAPLLIDMSVYKEEHR